MLAKLNVRLQLEHLSTHPQVQTALREGRLETHGWYYDIKTGEVQCWLEGQNRWAPVHESASGRSLTQGREARHA
jgi:carbonic anhydrase